MKNTTEQMKYTIAQLADIVRKSTTQSIAAKTISNTYKKLSPRAALVIVKDVQDHFDGKNTETELSLYIQDSGL